MDFTVIIPARLPATRLPGKLLLPVGDKPLLQHVFERARESGAGRVLIATDSDEIERAARAFGAEVTRTSERPASGTERVAEASALLKLDAEAIVVNTQGDEFDLPPALIDQAAANLARQPRAAVATLREEAACGGENDADTVKVVCDRDDFALYFSRAPIPYSSGDAGPDDAGPEAGRCWRHIGLYAYRVDFLRRFCRLPAGELERREQLEQLRALEHGYRIHAAKAVAAPGIGVDNERDLQRARQRCRAVGA